MEKCLKHVPLVWLNDENEVGFQFSGEGAQAFPSHFINRGYFLLGGILTGAR